GFECANVAAFAADDPALHIVRREHDRRHARLRRLVGGDALDREGDDLLRLPIGILFRLLGDVAHERRRLVARFALESSDELGLGVLGGQARDLLEACPNVLLALRQRAGALLQLLLELAQLLLAAVDAGDLLVEAMVEVFADRHELFFGGQDDPLARLGRAALEAPSPHVEGQCRDEHTAEHGPNGPGQLCHACCRYAATSRVDPGDRSERTVYSSPPIITRTACFFAVTYGPHCPAPALPKM